MSLPRTLCFGLLALALGCERCGGESADAPTDPAPRPEEPAPHPEVQEPATPRERPLGRWANGPNTGDPVEAEVVEVGADGAPSSIDLRDGGRVTLDPGTRIALGEDAPAQVLLIEGALHAQLPPMGGSSRPTLRIGTPQGTLAIEASGEAYLVAAPDGRVLFVELAGLGRIYDGEADDEGRPSSLPLRPGRSAVGGADETAEGVSGLDAARALRTPFASAGADAPSTRVTERRLAWLDRLIDEVDRERTRGHEIQRQRVIAAQAGDTERGAALQRDLIAHSQVVARQREMLRARFERVRALALLERLDPDPSIERRAEVRRLLGLEPTEASGDDSDASGGAQGEPAPD